MPRIKAYVPEGTFFEKKAATARRYGESIAILDTRNDFRAIAKRGAVFRGETGKSILFSDAAGISADDLAAVVSAPQKRFAVLAGKTCVAVCFPQLLRETGLLPVLCFQATRRDTQKLLEFAIRDAKSADFEVTERNFAHGESESGRSFAYIRSVCCQTERLLSSEDDGDVRTLLCLAANCAGCRIDDIVLPAPRMDLTAKSRKIFAAFLLCAFLSARDRSGDVSLFATGRNGSFTLTVEQADFALQKADPRLSRRTERPRERIPLFAGFADGRNNDSCVKKYPSIPVAALFDGSLTVPGDAELLKRFPFASASCFRDCVWLDGTDRLVFRGELRKAESPDLYSGIGNSGKVEIILTISLIPSELTENS